MHRVLAELVDLSLRLPSWAPRAARRAAAIALVLTMWLAPDSFRAGFELWVKTQTELIVDRMAPLLTPETSPPEPDQLPAERRAAIRSVTERLAHRS
jgi:hypothetical protein